MIWGWAFTAQDLPSAGYKGARHGNDDSQSSQESFFYLWSKEEKGDLKKNFKSSESSTKDSMLVTTSEPI